MSDRSGPSPVQSVSIWDRSDPSPKISWTGPGLDWTVPVWTDPLLDWWNHWMDRHCCTWPHRTDMPRWSNCSSTMALMHSSLLRKKRWRSLHFASKNGHTEVVPLLLDKGGDAFPLPRKNGRHCTTSQRTGIQRQSSYSSTTLITRPPLFEMDGRRYTQPNRTGPMRWLGCILRRTSTQCFH